MAVDSGTLVTKNDKTLLERGFKARCENISGDMRNKVGLKAGEPLYSRKLAEHLGVEIIELADLQHLEDDSKQFLASEEGNEWSAVTVANSKRIIVVVNPTHPDARKSSSLMHELAHVILVHDPGKVYITPEKFALRDYNEKQETEADWLAGSLLLPRVAFELMASRGVTKTAALSQYQVSSELFEYRKRMTGIRKQYRSFK
jgi:Zn-dependent peptidase ImmA (M78 family)